MNRTPNAIIDAFWLLPDEKPYNKITVKDDADRIIRSYGKSGAHLECVTYFINYCTKRKRAILHIYRSLFREYFINELDRIALYTVTQYVETVNTTYPVPPEDKALLIRFYKCLFTGVFIDWLNEGMQYDLSAYIARIDTLFEGSIEQAYQRSSLSAPNCH